MSAESEAPVDVAVADAPKPKRVLMLHGFSGNAASYSKHHVLESIRAECGQAIEFVFVDPPYIPSQDRPSRFSSEYTGGSRPWWRMNPAYTKAVGLEATFEFFRDLMKESHFDGVFGMSQGAAMAAMLSALLENPSLYPPFLVDGQPPHPPLEFCICVGGFRINDPLAHKIFAAPYATPTVHVIGRSDYIIEPERSQDLASVNTHARIEEHDGGHWIPSGKGWCTFFGRWMRDPRGEVESPGEIVDSGRDFAKWD